MNSPSKKRFEWALSFVAGVALTAAVFGVALFTLNAGDKPAEFELSDELEAELASVQASTLKVDESKPTDGSLDTVDSLQDLSRFKSKFARSAALHSLLARSDENTLLDLIAESEEIALPSRQTAWQEAIFQRYATINPERAISRAELFPSDDQGVLMGAIFGEWSHSDLDGAVGRAMVLDESLRVAAMRGILNSRDDLSENLRRQIAKQLGNEQVAVELFAQATLNETIDNPEATWNALTSDEIDDIGQTATLVQVAQSWVDQSGFEVLPLMSESLPNWQTRMTILGSVIHRAALTDPQGAFNHAASLGDNGEGYILSSLVRTWADSEPMAALESVRTLEQNRFSRELADTVIRIWASNDPYAVLDRLETLPEDLRARGRERAVVSLAGSSPEEAARLLADIESGESRREVGWAVASSWAEQDVHGALNWVLNSPQARDMQRDLLSVVLRELAQVDPQLALDTALNQPLSENQTGLEVTVIGELTRRNLSQAIELLSKVRDGRTKLRAYSEVGSALVYSGDRDRALKLAQDFSEPSRTNYYNDILNAWLRSDPEDLVDSLPDLPSEQVKSRAALVVAISTRWNRSLDEEQLAYAKSFLSEEDARHLEQRTSGSRNWRRR